MSELVTLVTVHDPVEAEIIMAKLRSAGIPVYNKHEAAGTVYGLTDDGLAKQEIIVRAEDLFEAQAAIEQDID